MAPHCAQFLRLYAHLLSDLQRVEVRALTPDEGRGAGRSERTARVRPQPPAEPPRATVPDTSVSADEFERWMQTQGIRFAAGKPGEAKPAAAEPDKSPTPAPLPSEPVQ